VFSVPTRVHARYGAKQIPYFFRRYILQQNVEKPRLPGGEVVDYHENTFKEEKESVPDKRV
jgi:hypothetical protein